MIDEKLTSTQREFLRLLAPGPRICLVSYAPARALIRLRLARWVLPKPPELKPNYMRVEISDAGRAMLSAGGEGQ